MVTRDPSRASRDTLERLERRLKHDVANCPEDCKDLPCDHRDLLSLVQERLAELPPLRTRAEVDTERLLNLDANMRGVIDYKCLRERDAVLRAEPTREEFSTCGVCGLRLDPGALCGHMPFVEPKRGEACAQCRRMDRKCTYCVGCA